MFGQFASGVTVVTVGHPNGTPHGATVTAFTSVSQSPRLCQVTLTKSSLAGQLLPGANFAVNILASDQTETALHFAGRPQDRPISWDKSNIAPSLTGCLATVWCRPWTHYDGGDHVLYLGEIVDAEVNTEADPILFFRSGFHTIGPESRESCWNFSADDPFGGWFGANAPLTPLP
ncbi:flavin reductase family protein [Corynebacterium sp. TAE3-ERU16]|uniref:flavin reductase family protein n=1 Tax=Corynebacterium sp. TAE3-ERU16 TaxID=2849493 RepID=UPI00351CCC49